MPVGMFKVVMSIVNAVAPPFNPLNWGAMVRYLGGNSSGYTSIRGFAEGSDGSIYGTCGGEIVKSVDGSGDDWAGVYTAGTRVAGSPSHGGGDVMCGGGVDTPASLPVFYKSVNGSAFITVPTPAYNDSRAVIKLLSGFWLSSVYYTAIATNTTRLIKSNLAGTSFSVLRDDTTTKKLYQAFLQKSDGTIIAGGTSITAGALVLENSTDDMTTVTASVIVGDTTGSVYVLSLRANGDGSMFVGCIGNNKILVSNDGINWTVKTTTTSILTAEHIEGDSWIGIGETGYIVTTDDNFDTSQSLVEPLVVADCYSSIKTSTGKIMLGMLDGYAAINPPL